MARAISAFIVIGVSIGSAGCASGPAGSPSEEVVDTERERVTGGTTGAGSASNPLGCQYVSADHVNIKISNEPVVFIAAEDLYCSCPERGINNGAGRLRRDDPNAPSTFMCRAPLEYCWKVSLDHMTIKVSTNPDRFLYADGEPCNCTDWGISYGKLRRDDPNAPSSFMCRAQ